MRYSILTVRTEMLESGSRKGGMGGVQRDRDNRDSVNWMAVSACVCASSNRHESHTTVCVSVCLGMCE